MGHRTRTAVGLILLLGGWGCDPTTIPDYVLDAEVDAEIDMEVDMGPTACERACAGIAECAAGEDLCVGIGSAEYQAAVDLCSPVCANASALASVINGAEACRDKVAFFEGASAAFQRLCNTPPQADMGVVEADMAVVEADMAVVEADMGVVEADMAVVEADMAVVEVDMAVVEADMAIDEADMSAP